MFARGTNVVSESENVADERKWVSWHDFNRNCPTIDVYIYIYMCVKSIASMMIHFTDDENTPTAFKPSLTIADVRQ